MIHPNHKRPDEWPDTPVGKAIIRWTDAGQMNRVYIIERTNGTYGIYHEDFNIVGLEEYQEYGYWIGGLQGSIFDSKETALGEIYGQYPWSSTSEPEQR